MQDVSLHLAKLDEKVSTLFVGFPDAGLVGLISSTQIIHDGAFKNVGWIDLGDFMPPTAIVHSGLPFSPIQVYERGGMAVISAEVPIPAEAAKPVGDLIMGLARKISANEIVTMGGLASDDRYEEETQPSVYFVSSDPEGAKRLAQTGIAPLEGGLLMGTYAHLVMSGLKEGLAVNSFYANAYPRMPDPGAAAALLNAISRVYPIKVDTENLIKQSEEIRLRTKQIMQQVTSSAKPAGSFMYT
ncbi:MAG: PAC2 family protein [Candidatus Marsarchaeota archaeon]